LSSFSTAFEGRSAIVILFGQFELQIFDLSVLLALDFGVENVKLSSFSLEDGSQD